MRKIARGDYLYHYTSIDGFLNIWESRSLKPSYQDQDPRPAVCLTRNPNMHLQWKHRGIRLTLDARKLNAALTPFLHQHDEKSFKYEAEERCYKEIKNLLRYLVRVDININQLDMTEKAHGKIDYIIEKLYYSDIPYHINALSNSLIAPEEKRKFLDPELERLFMQFFQCLTPGRGWGINDITKSIREIETCIEDTEQLITFEDNIRKKDILALKIPDMIDIIYDYSLLLDEIVLYVKQIVVLIQKHMTELGITKKITLESIYGEIPDIDLREIQHRYDQIMDMPILTHSKPDLQYIADGLKQGTTLLKCCYKLRNKKEYLLALKTSIEHRLSLTK